MSSHELISFLNYFSSICKESRISYEQIKEFKIMCRLKGKIIAAILANNGYKFDLASLPIKIILSKEIILKYIDIYGNFLIKNNVNNDYDKHIQFIIQFNELLIDKMLVNSENLVEFTEKYISIEDRIIEISRANLNTNIKEISELKDPNKPKLTFIIMAIANKCQDRTNFKII